MALGYDLTEPTRAANASCVPMHITAATITGIDMRAMTALRARATVTHLIIQ